MPRSVTIRTAMSGRSVASTLGYAVDILSANKEQVDSSAQHTMSDGRIRATILLSYLDDRPRALQLLRTAGIDAS
jgi:hypothetical protein